MKKKICLLGGMLILISFTAFAQVQKAQTLQIGNTSTNSQNASAALQIDDINRGFLPPRLTSTQRNAITNPATGLSIYNSTTNCMEWYNGLGWYNACGGDFYSYSSGGSAIVSAYTCSTGSAGTMTAGTVVSGVTQTITATVTTAGTYNISATANGVTFTGTGTFLGTGAQNIVLTATGTPTAGGTSSFVLNTSTNCNFNRVIIDLSSNGTANVSGYSCSTASAGTMTAGTTVSGVTQTITATVATAGTYNISATANGVTFTGSGTFTGTGNQTVILTATGTPTYGSNSITYNLNTTPTCSFTRLCIGYPAGYSGFQTAIVEVTSASGKVWMDRNLGASQVAQSNTDYLAYGKLFQWGRSNDGHADITWTSGTAGTAVNGTTTVLSTTDSPSNSLFITKSASPYDWRSPKNNNLWQGLLGTNNVCPAGYRLPTSTELSTEFTTYSITNNANAYSNCPLKFPSAGYRLGTVGLLGSIGGIITIWSSTVSGIYANDIQINSINVAVQATNRSQGCSVRCIKD